MHPDGWREFHFLFFELQRLPPARAISEIQAVPGERWNRWTCSGSYSLSRKSRDPNSNYVKMLEMLAFFQKYFYIQYIYTLHYIHMYCTAHIWKQLYANHSEPWSGAFSVFWIILKQPKLIAVSVSSWISRIESKQRTFEKFQVNDSLHSVWSWFFFKNTCKASHNMVLMEEIRLTTWEYKTLEIMGWTAHPLSTGAGFLPSTTSSQIPIGGNLGDPLEDPLEHPSHFFHVFGTDSGLGAEPSSGTEVPAKWMGKRRG